MKRTFVILMILAVFASIPFVFADKSSRDNENKNVICHLTGDVIRENARRTVYKGVVIAVSDKAAEAHIAHGDKDIRDGRVEQGPATAVSSSRSSLHSGSSCRPVVYSPPAFGVRKPCFRFAVESGAFGRPA